MFKFFLVLIVLFVSNFSSSVFAENPDVNDDTFYKRGSVTAEDIENVDAKEENFLQVNRSAFSLFILLVFLCLVALVFTLFYVGNTQRKSSIKMNAILGKIDEINDIFCQIAYADEPSLDISGDTTMETLGQH